MLPASSQSQTEIIFQDDDQLAVLQIFSVVGTQCPFYSDLHSSLHHEFGSTIVDLTGVLDLSAQTIGITPSNIHTQTYQHTSWYECNQKPEKLG